MPQIILCLSVAEAGLNLYFSSFRAVLTTVPLSWVPSKASVWCPFSLSPENLWQWILPLNFSGRTAWKQSFNCEKVVSENINLRLIDEQIGRIDLFIQHFFQMVIYPFIYFIISISRLLDSIAVLVSLQIKMKRKYIKKS